MKRFRLILADDHRIFAEGLERILAEHYELIDLVHDGKSLLQAVDSLNPDLVIADVSMPGMNGIDCVRHLGKTHPELKILLLTMHEDLSLASAALRAGASGYVLKHTGARGVLQAVEEVLQGRIHVSPQLESCLHSSIKSSKNGCRELTPRQLDILRLIVSGLSAKEIAAKLDLSPRTVEFHKYKAMERVGAQTSAELIQYAVKAGIGEV
ncbi:MAG: DNA-binding response regulator [Planctomycetota bacterium]|nr:MAG: DNA-binding response regulator [Planctomycetota bacterium]